MEIHIDLGYGENNANGAWINRLQGVYFNVGLQIVET